MLELMYYAHNLSSDFEEVLVIPISDVHYGDPLCSEHHYNRILETLLMVPNAFTILNGDLCNAATRTSVSDIYSQVVSPQGQRDYHIKKLMPVKHKILGSTSGNHENRIYKDSGLDISQDIANALGVPYRAEGLLLKVSFGNGNEGHPEKPYSYFIYATHGYGGARTKAAKAVKVERLATWIHADCYIMSHDHVVNVAPDVYLIPDNRTHKEGEFMIGKVKAHRKMLVKSGAFLKWGGYGEMGGFPPVDLEKVTIKLKGTGKPRVGVEI